LFKKPFVDESRCATDPDINSGQANSGTGATFHAGIEIGALNILINAISIWNTVYLTEATKQLKTDERVKELLPHVSPLAWEHINFLGEYTFDLRTQQRWIR